MAKHESLDTVESEIKRATLRSSYTKCIPLGTLAANMAGEGDSSDDEDPFSEHHEDRDGDERYAGWHSSGRKVPG